MRTPGNCPARQMCNAAGQSGQEIAYNHLDLPRKITKNAAVLGKYSYLSDGTLVETVRGDGCGLA